MSLNRRALIGAALTLPLATPALASNPAPRSLSILNLHTGERLAANYWESGADVEDALAGLAKVLRDHRTGETHAMAPRLLDLVADLQAEFSAKPVQVISGYRSPRTNEALRQSGGGGLGDLRGGHGDQWRLGGAAAAGRATDPVAGPEVRRPPSDERCRDVGWGARRSAAGFGHRLVGSRSPARPCSRAC